VNRGFADSKSPVVNAVTCDGMGVWVSIGYGGGGISLRAVFALSTWMVMQPDTSVALVPVCVAHSASADTLCCASSAASPSQAAAVADSSLASSSPISPSSSPRRAHCAETAIAPVRSRPEWIIE
jgi:hypothetical protein